MKNRFFVLMGIGVFCACNSGTAKEETAAETEVVDSATVAQQPQPAPDTLTGAVYSGLLPCVDCDSIQTVVAGRVILSPSKWMVVRLLMPYIARA